MAELVDRSDSAQDAAFTGIFEEPHKTDRGVPAHCKLSKRERSRPGLGIHEPDREPKPEPDHQPAHQPAHEPGHEPYREPEPDHEPDHESECNCGLVADQISSVDSTPGSTASSARSPLLFYLRTGRGQAEGTTEAYARDLALFETWRVASSRKTSHRSSAASAASANAILVRP